MLLTLISYAEDIFDRTPSVFSGFKLILENSFILRISLASIFSSSPAFSEPGSTELNSFGITIMS